MIQQSSCQFISWVKIRIGEPLTAIEIDKEKILFGSISGYIGYFDLESKKVHYYEPINEEIIRGIYSQGNKAYFAIGDKHVLIKDLADRRDERISIVRSHSNNVCSHSMTMMYGLKEVIFAAFPTQKRETLPTDLDLEKNNLYEIDIANSEVRTHRQFKTPQIFVPFDFDGKRILWMEYQKDKVKQFQCYNLASKQITSVKNFGNKFHFLSFGKLLGKDVVFIENNKNIKLLNTENDQIMDLYSHTSSVIAFDVAEREDKFYRLVSVDFNGIFKEWKNGVVHQHALWTVKNVPEGIKSHQYLFDMGYPYYLKVFKNILAITTDLGLCIFRI